MNTRTTDTEICTAQGLATLLGCDKETAEERIRSGDLPGTKFGKGWIIPRQALMERLNEKAREEAAARRAKLQGDQTDAAARGAAAATKTEAPSPMLPSSEPRRMRGQRRKPPDLSGLLASQGLVC